jgi:hypothetical protein
MARKRRRRAWLTAIPIGVVVGVLALIVFRNSGSSPGIGPIDIAGGLAIGAGTVLVVLPSNVGIVRQRRAARALLVWTALMFFLALAELAQHCSKSEPNCHGSHDPLIPLLIWLVGFLLLSLVWMRTGPRRR